MEQEKERRKQYNNTHMEQIKASRLLNKEKAKIRDNVVEQCICGLTHTHGNKSGHYKTAKHKNYIANQTIDV